MRFFSTIIGILALTITSCTAADDAVSTAPITNLPAAIEKNASYGNHTQQTYDLYLPANRKANTTQTIVLLHGGSWVSGDKSSMDFMVQRIQSSLPNHAIINMNYRLANGSTVKAFPNQLEDIELMLDTLQEQSGSWQISDKTTLLGVSAGAHLSLLYAAAYDESDQVNKVINIVGPTDFTDDFYAGNPSFQFMFNALVDVPALNTNDPVTAVSPAQRITTSMPAVFNFYGNQDRLVALSQLESLEKALDQFAIPYESTIYDGGHANWNESQLQDLEDKIKSFLGG
ncbi:alpha/beta hydrolase [Nonlabens ponticola]|nr:alpha/beta hydrolase [Nonlabens ponticola]